MNQRYFILPALAALLLPLAFTPGRCRAEDFRVDTRVFAGSQPTPQSEGTTIFCEGFVYDFLKGDDEVIVLDRAQHRYVLLNLARNVRTELTQQEVNNFVDLIKGRTTSNSDPIVKFYGAPTFQQSFDPVAMDLKMQSDWLVYDARLVSASNDAVLQYRDFSDSCAKLNAVLYPASRPPFARMILNEAIAAHHGIAREVHLTVKNAHGDSQTVRSEHELTPRLEAADRHRVAEYREDMTTFRAVEYIKYHASVTQK
jgi:hypothetical protein